jgi:hypothetical protein
MSNMNKPAYNKPAPMPMPPQTKPIYGKPAPKPPVENKPIYGKPVSPGDNVARPAKPVTKPLKEAMENMPVPRNDMGGNGFTPYAAGKKHYGTGRGAPNVGATGNMAGYAMRDGKAAARRQALMRRTGGM